MFEVERCERILASDWRRLVAPLQSPGNHQVEDEPHVVVEPDRNAFADTAEFDDGSAVDGSTWGEVSFDTHGAKNRIRIDHGKTNVETLRTHLTFNGGNVKIKAVNIYGSKMSQ